MKFSGDTLGRSILVIASMLTFLGVLSVMSSSATIGASYSLYGYDSLFFVKRQCIGVILGIGLLLFVRRCINLDDMRDKLGLGGMIVSIILAIAMQFCPEQNGAHRWITLGPFNLQVGEIAKLACIFFWADLLARNSSKIGEKVLNVDAAIPWYKRWVREFCADIRPYRHPLGLTTILIVLIECGHDLGMVILITFTLLGILYVAGLQIRIITRACAVFFVGLAPLILSMGYRVERIRAWLSPLKFYDSCGYQTVNSFIAIASGGLFGRGVPFSGQKYGFLPEQHTDFIYAVICEEIGFAGTMGFLLLFFALFFCGFKLAARCKDHYRSLLAFGIMFQFALQLLVNIGVVTGTLPNKGLPLPFVSYGGTSMMMTLAAVGVLLNIADSYRSYGKMGLKNKRRMQRVRRAATISSSDSGRTSIPVGAAGAYLRSRYVHGEPQLPVPSASQEKARVINIRPFLARQNRRIMK